MNFWSALSSIVGSLVIGFVVVMLFAGDDVVEAIRAWKGEK